DHPAQVAEHHQVFAQDLDPARDVRELLAETDRLPEAAHVFAAGRARSDMRELGVLAGNFAVKVAAELGPQEGGSGRHDFAPDSCERDRFAAFASVRAHRGSEVPVSTKISQQVCVNPAAPEHVESDQENYRSEDALEHSPPPRDMNRGLDARKTTGN